MAEEQIAPTEEIQATPKEEEIASPVEEKKEKPWFKPLLFSILGLLLVTGLVFAGYKFAQREAQSTPQPSPVITPTPTPDPTADWETYTNSSLGISFKYPENWNVELVKSTLHINPQGGSFTVVAYPIDDQTLRATKETYVTTDTQRVTQRRIDHAEYEITEYALTFKDVPGAGRSTVIDVVEYKDRAFLWQLSDLQFKEIFNLILSTFRFLEEEAEGEKVLCEEPRPQVCTMECIVNPPYICGSDGKSYCSECQACADPDIKWYVIQDEPCEAE